MSKLPLLLRTVRHLRPVQVAYQIRYRLCKPRFRQLKAPAAAAAVPGWTQWIEKCPCLMPDGTLRFLNIGDSFRDWNFAGHGALWAYNLNYMDWLCQEGMTLERGAEWINRFIDGLPAARTGLDPYPIALRGINWIKFICRHCRGIEPGQLQQWNDALYSQYRLLERKLEFHLLGNHLLEDAFSLFIGSVYFRDVRLYRKACRLLRHELAEQILPDGAHFEQSPMYHSIMLDRLLDCLSLAQHAQGLGGLQQMADFLKAKAARMLGHLESICYADGSLPLFGDSALGIAPTPGQLFGYASRLGVEWEAIPLSACGYRHMQCGDMEAFVDVGNIAATYQPGHTHADSLSYELRIGGKPFVVDTGISTYNKTARRQYERSTAAHNAVSAGGRSSSEVWSGFRVARRCRTAVVRDGQGCVEAWHDGFEKPCRRIFSMGSGEFRVEDRYDGEAVSYIHLAGDADVQRIAVENASETIVRDSLYARQYNRLLPGKTLEIHFNGFCQYSIKP